MKRLDRGKVKAPANWTADVARAFADFVAFGRAARKFERLPINSAERRAGFLAYTCAHGIACFRTKAEFKSLWGKAKEKLAEMSSDKCAYCEGEINSARAGQVEHFKPKTIFPILAYDWGNYFLACGGCNGAKSNKWPSRGGYLRPDEGDPSTHLRFDANGQVSALRKGKADETVRDFDLNRRPLVRRRKKHIGDTIQELNGLLEVFAVKPSLGRKLIRRQFARISSPAMVYSVALKQCASRISPRFPG